MNNNEFCWLSLESFVHGIVTGNDVLLYNTVSKKHLIYKEKPEIAAIVRNILDPVNGYVVSLHKDELEIPRVKQFISDLRKKYMGDLFDPHWSQSKPFNIAPSPIVKKGVKGLANYLNEITFHVNSSGLPYLEDFKDACLQFPFPIYSANPDQVLSLDMIRSVAVQIASLPVATVNFVGSGIAGEPMFSDLAGIFRNTPFRRKFHVPLNHLSFPLHDSLGKSEYLAAYVTFPVSLQQLDILHLICTKYAKNSRLECNFVVTENRDIELAMDLIAQMNIRRPFFKPYLREENVLFFKEQVYITEEDIMTSKPSQNQIFSRLTMNENDYGKLTVLPNGDVCSNINDKPLGNLMSHSIEELVDQEVTAGKNWNRRRSVVEPCKNCLYQFLCPPISNYEILSQHYNFCHIYR